MMATPHLLTGAAIGRSLNRRPWLALPAAFASHFLLDATPHLDSNDIYGSANGWTVPEVGIGVADFILGCILVVLLTRARPWRPMAVWGAFFAMVIDLAYTIPPWGPLLTQWSGTAWLDRFHHGIQPDVAPENLLLGFGTQAAVMLIAGGLLARRDAAQAEHDDNAQ
ncbi:MAG: hypothetical protein R6V07_07620 [Armatimonadota bacterium]